MGTIANKFLVVENEAELNDRLMVLYAFELNNKQLVSAIIHRFAGMNEILFKEKAIQIKEEMNAFHKTLKERLGLRSIDIPMTLKEVYDLNPHEFNLDVDPNNTADLMKALMEIYQVGVDMYGKLLEMTAGKNAIVYHEILPIFQYYADMESELEIFGSDAC